MSENPPDTTSDGSASSGIECLVIGPIGDRLAEHGSPEREIYERSLAVLVEVIEPACKQFGIDPIRSDGISAPGDIPEQILRLLYEAGMVIADITGGNPNVMYELGLRHTRDLCTIMIAENERTPFDVCKSSDYQIPTY